jgi:hypothetical protein
MKYVMTLIGGLVLGILATLFFLGSARAKAAPGAAVKPPDAGSEQAGTALITLDEKFFDALLGKVFQDLGAPSFPLQLSRADLAPTVATFQPAAFQGDCKNAVTLASEGSNVKTGVRFTGGKIMLPMAFNGSYNAPLVGCTRFKGWAQTVIQLRFDQANQKLYAEVNVEGVNLEGVSPVVSGLITPLVQRTINERVNPIEMMRAEQLTLAVPIKAAGGTLSAKVKDVRAEINDGTLRLHISYDFTK